MASGGAGGGGPIRRSMMRGERPAPYSISGLFGIDGFVRAPASLFSQSKTPATPSGAAKGSTSAATDAAISSLISGSTETIQVGHQQSQIIKPENQITHSTALDYSDGGRTFSTSNIDTVSKCDNQTLGNNDGLEEILQLIKRRHFLRDEADRIMVLLRSRTVDVCNDTLKVNEDAPVPNAARWNRQLDSQCAMANDIFHHNVHIADSSPIDIAKAYMMSKNSATYQDDAMAWTRIKDSPIEDRKSALDLFHKTPTKSTICWPGSIAQSNTKYLSPYMSRGETRKPVFSNLSNSRSLFSRSNKIQKALDNETGFSGLSQHYKDNNVAPSSMGTGLENVTSPSLPSSSVKGQAALLSQAYLHKFESNRSQGESAAQADCAFQFSVSSHVHPKSSQTAQKILNHLNRAIGSPTTRLQFSTEEDVAKSKAADMLEGPDTAVQLRSDILEEHQTSSIHAPEKRDMALNVSDSEKDSRSATQSPENGRAISVIHRVSSRQAPTRDESVPDDQPANKVCKEGSTTSTRNTFTFPLNPPSNTSTEPAPAPTFTPHAPPVTCETVSNGLVPTFQFGSSKSSNGPVISFDFYGDTAMNDVTSPVFNFGSAGNQRLVFQVE